MITTAETILSPEYGRALEIVRRLSVREQLVLIQAVAASLRRSIVSEPRRRNIRELRGLGKELWAKINIDEYVRQERSAWG